MDYGRGHHKSARALPEEGPAFVYTAENRARLEEICTRYPPERRKSAILYALYIAQGQQGYLTLNAMRHVAEKARAAGAPGVILTERGTTFGYGDLVTRAGCDAVPAHRQIDLERAVLAELGRVRSPVVLDGDLEVVEAARRTDHVAVDAGHAERFARRPHRGHHRLGSNGGPEVEARNRRDQAWRGILGQPGRDHAWVTGAGPANPS